MIGWLAASVSVLAMASVVSACAFRWAPAFQETAPPGLFDDVAIADPDDALTFARVDAGGTRRVLAVTAYHDGMVTGVDLGRALGRPVDDPVTVFAALGYEALRDLVRDPPPSAVVTVPAERLGVPVDLGDHHVAAATNFPEHADDAGVKNGPFLFAKMVAPTGPRADVAAGSALLDYEVEVAWVTLAPLAAGDRPEHLGLVLCNDYTDRDTLLGALDPWDVASGAGFTTGKSFPGYLPVGDLFVVPRDHRRFVADLELRLYVDDALRQRAPGRAMVWDLDAIVAHTFAWKDRRWDHRGTEVSLLDGADVVPARTLLLSGTPHGTIFDGLQARHYAKGLGAWLFGGFGTPIPRHVVAAYVADARAARIYLQPGSEVAIHVDRMGVVRNRIVAGAPRSG